jgi:hypothetical protein
MKTSKEIFRDILFSAQTNCVLKIKLKHAKNPVITAVDNVLKNQIILKPTCLYGYEIRRRSIKLIDIESVTRYRTNFDHPMFVRLRFIKNNIAASRYDLKSLDPHTAGFEQGVSRGRPTVPELF